jgi:hypothetical protein
MSRDRSRSHSTLSTAVETHSGRVGAATYRIEITTTHATTWEPMSKELWDDRTKVRPLMLEHGFLYPVAIAKPRRRRHWRSKNIG